MGLAKLCRGKEARKGGRRLVVAADIEGERKDAPTLKPASCAALKTQYSVLTIHAQRVVYIPPLPSPRAWRFLGDGRETARK